MATVHDASMADTVSGQESLSATSSARSTRSYYLCVPHCKILRNRGALLVLFWSFCGLCVFNAMMKLFFDFGLMDTKLVILTSVLPASLLLCPVFGWLADVRYGRYKVIKWSLRISLVVLILFCLVSALLEYFLQERGHVAIMVRMALLILMGFSGSFFQVSIIQFGIDQLTDASSIEIILYLRWYVWLYFLSDIVVTLSQSCLCSDYEAVGFLLLATLVSIAVSSDLVFNHWLVKEPPSANPFILIFRVLHYAMKHKHPRLRSAFTYWDDKPYRRIDLAKTMYGGPYSTEQVEDVKTFFRMVSIIIAGGFFSGWYAYFFPVYLKVLNHLKDDNNSIHECAYSYAYLKDCFQRQAVVRSSGSVLVLIFVPLFEFVFYSFIKCYWLRISILKKAVFGMCFALLGLLSCSAIEFSAHYLSSQYFNATCHLPLSEKDMSTSLPVDFKWMIIPYSLISITIFLFFMSVFEFVCAQSPYSMKGLLFGFGYGSVAFFTIVGYFFMQIVQLISGKITLRFGCIFWHLIFGLGILTTIFMIFLLFLKCYRRRSRGDNEHNEHMFAVNYYSS